MYAAVAPVTVVIKEGHSSTFLILAPALAGIVGALIGGLTAGRFALKSEDKRQAFDRDREDKRNQREDAAYLALVRGAGRVLSAQIRSVDQALRLAMETNHWWPRDMVGVPTLSLDDLKLLAGFLQTEDWKSVAAAMAMCERVILRRDREPDPSPDPIVATPLSVGDLPVLQAARETLVRAMRDLQAVG